MTPRPGSLISAFKHGFGARVATCENRYEASGLVSSDGCSAASSAGQADVHRRHYRQLCGKDGHSQMRMGPTDAECAVACISAHGASYVLYDGKDVYTLSDQKTPEKFAAQKVRVIGTLDDKTKTIQVDSITAAK